MREDSRIPSSLGGRDPLEPDARMAGPRQMRLGAALMLTGLLVSFTGVHAKLTVESRWQDRDSGVAIDGSADEWQGAMTYVEKPGLEFGVRNDDEYLYICLHSSNRHTAAQVLLQGLTVGLGDKLTVQFPIGMMAPGGPPRGAPDRDRMRERATDSLILTRSGTGEPQHLPVENGLGVEVRLVTEPELVYELKVPLTQTEAFPYAVEAESGDKITVRVDTPKMERPEMTGRPGGPGGGMRGGSGGGMPGGPGGGRPGGPGGGMPGGGTGGGMPGGGRGGGRPDGMGDRPERPEPIHFRVKVHLAADRDEQ